MATPRVPADVPVTTTRISIGRRTARWSDGPVAVSDAMDFWSFAAGAANVIMQLSRPEVGYGVVESKVDSGNLFKHPWKRARTTFQYLAVAVFGDDEDRAAYREAVDAVHRQVRSTPASPVSYNAFDRDLQMWVAACLFVGLEDTYQLLRGEMTPEQAEQFYRSAWPLGTTLQVGAEQWPATRAAFDDYWNAACRRVAVDDVVRGYLRDLVDLKMVNPLLRLPFRPLLRFLTAGFLAPVFRDALGMSWSERRQRHFERLFLLVALVNRFIPPFLRQGGSHLLLADVRRRVRRGKLLL
ncbi:oxygenase MpaB family protein [Mycobacterium sp. 663a-19]|uniref:oxygenase MpaB family protein n=1 Tax=Mycobacterium sp. 663a-19 TaxID=2986148 RepID=UPI002D1EC33F|nr:oxygenase MpaB family protein [Mycobacterium sp. 663a-19]MEB3984092.1 oxygenase MpaB family protein [Mycobacterium sp. 663a-19]